MIIVSACLAGIDCRYDGGSNLIREVRDLVAAAPLVGLNLSMTVLLPESAARVAG